MKELKDILDDAGIDTSKTYDKPVREPLGKNTLYDLVLWNDEYNHVDLIVHALMKICKLSEEESLNLAKMAHLTGKQTILRGSRVDMELLHRVFSQVGIVTTVESISEEQ